MGAVTDADILARLIEADPALGPVVAEGRALLLGDCDMVEIFAAVLSDLLRREYGAPPRTTLAHIVEHDPKRR